MDQEHPCSALFGSLRSLLSAQFFFGGKEQFNGMVKQFKVWIDKELGCEAVKFEKK